MSGEREGEVLIGESAGFGRRCEKQASTLSQPGSSVYLRLSRPSYCGIEQQLPVATDPRHFDLPQLFGSFESSPSAQ